MFVQNYTVCLKKTKLNRMLSERFPEMFCPLKSLFLHNLSACLNASLWHKSLRVVCLHSLEVQMKRILYTLLHVTAMHQSVGYNQSYQLSFLTVDTLVSPYLLHDCQSDRFISLWCCSSGRLAVGTR